MKETGVCDRMREPIPDLATGDRLSLQARLCPSWAGPHCRSQEDDDLLAEALLQRALPSEAAMAPAG